MPISGAYGEAPAISASIHESGQLSGRIEDARGSIPESVHCGLPATYLVVKRRARVPVGIFGRNLLPGGIIAEGGPNSSAE